PTGAIAARRVSGLAFHSTFKLSAPSEARKRVPPADARNQEKSKMRIPASGNGVPFAEMTGSSSLERAEGKRTARTGSLRTAAVCSPPIGARPPGCQAVAVLSHLLVG